MTRSIQFKTYIEKCILIFDTNTHHDVKAFKVDGIVQNTQKLIPQEQYMIFIKYKDS